MIYDLTKYICETQKSKYSVMVKYKEKLFCAFSLETIMYISGVRKPTLSLQEST